MCCCSGSHSTARCCGPMQMGNSEANEALGVASRGDDAAAPSFVVGATRGDLGGQPSGGGWDAFIVRVESNGTVAWTRLRGAAGDTYAHAVAAAPSGDWFCVAGATQDSLGEVSHAGGSDAFVSRVDAQSGLASWTRLVASSAGLDAAFGVALFADGSIVVAGASALSGAGDGFVAKLSAEGVVQWTRTLGSAAPDELRAVVVLSNGDVAAVGIAGGSIDSEAFRGGASDVILARLDAGNGSVRWTRLEGSAQDDGAFAAAASASDLVVAGQTSCSFSAGLVNSGDQDTFIASFCPSRDPCAAGYAGFCAATCVACAAGTFALANSTSCSACPCTGRGNCSVTTGECVCLSRYSGADCANPAVLSVSPIATEAQQLVTITGEFFGAAPGAVRLFYAAIDFGCSIESWSAERIVCNLFDGAGGTIFTNSRNLTVTRVDGNASTPFALTLDPPTVFSPHAYARDERNGDYDSRPQHFWGDRHRRAHLRRSPNQLVRPSRTQRLCSPRLHQFLAAMRGAACPTGSARSLVGLQFDPVPSSR